MVSRKMFGRTLTARMKQASPVWCCVGECQPRLRSRDPWTRACAPRTCIDAELLKQRLGALLAGRGREQQVSHRPVGDRFDRGGHQGAPLAEVAHGLVELLPVEHGVALVDDLRVEWRLGGLGGWVSWVGEWGWWVRWVDGLGGVDWLADWLAE